MGLKPEWSTAVRLQTYPNTQHELLCVETCTSMPSQRHKNRVTILKFTSRLLCSRWNRYQYHELKNVNRHLSNLRDFRNTHVDGCVQTCRTKVMCGQSIARAISLVIATYHNIHVLLRLVASGTFRTRIKDFSVTSTIEGAIHACNVGKFRNKFWPSGFTLPRQNNIN